MKKKENLGARNLQKKQDQEDGILRCRKDDLQALNRVCFRYYSCILTDFIFD